MSLTPREQDEVETALGLAAPPVAPSPELKASLMSLIASTPQQAAPQASSQSQSQSQPDSAGQSAHRAKVRWFSRPGLVLASAAAAILLFGIGTMVGVGIASQNTVNIEAERLAQLSAAPDLQRETSEVAGGGVATLIWSLDQGRSAILIDAMPSLPVGKTYQLWYIDSGGVASSAGTFEAKSEATTWRVLDGELHRGDTVGLTVEPDGGSASPTTDPILAISSS